MPNDRKLWILGGAMAVAGLALWTFWQVRSSPGGPAVSSIVAATSGQDLVVQAWIETNRPRQGDTVRVRFTFENRGTTPAANIYWSEFNFPGLVPQGDCWSKSLTGPACWTGTGIERPAFSTVDPGQSATAQAEMRVADEAGKSSLAAVYTWQQGGKERTGEISAGPLQVATPVHDAAAAFFGLAAEIAKAFLIPAVLALLGLWISSRLNRSQFLTTTLENQFPRFQEFVEKHYLPITRSMRAALKSLKDLKGNDAATEAMRQDCLFNVLMFLRRMLQLRGDKGGVFFKSHSGEAVFRETWIRIQAALNQQLVDWEARAKDVRLDDTPATFQRARELKQQPVKEALTEAQNRLADWARSEAADDCRGYVNLAIAVLHFEANRAFVGSWYVESENDGGKPDCVKTCTEMIGMLPDKDSLRELLQTYLGYLVHPRRSPWQRLLGNVGVS